MSWPNTLSRTKNWGSEVLTDTDLEGQFDNIISWTSDLASGTAGHAHTGAQSQGPKISVLASTVTGNTIFSGSITFSGTVSFTGTTSFAGGNFTDAVNIVQADDDTHINLSGDPENSSPSDGDLWFDGTNLKFYGGTTTYNLNSGSAREIAVGTSAITTTSTSYVDMTDMSVTFVADGVRSVSIRFHGVIEGTAHNNAEPSARIIVGSTEKIAAHAWTNASETDDSIGVPFAMEWCEVLDAGSHTIKVQWKTNTATIYQTGTTYKRILIAEY